MKYLIAIIIFLVYMDPSATSRYSFCGSSVQKSRVISGKNLSNKVHKKKLNKKAIDTANVEFKLLPDNRGKKSLSDGNEKRQIKFKLSVPTLSDKIEKRAREDIANGLIYIIVNGNPALRYKDKPTKLSKLTAKYGFQYAYMIGCIFSSNEHYNRVVKDYLTERNGEGWWDRFLKEKSELLDESERVPLYEL